MHTLDVADAVCSACGGQLIEWEGQTEKKQGAGFRIAHCWAHVRRKFIEAEASAKPQSAEVLDLIGKLCEVERAITGPPERRLRARNELSRPLIAQIHRRALSTTCLP